MKHLLALLLLSSPAFADGSHFVTGNDTTIPLDAPPPGATALEVRFVYSDCLMNSGVEHLGSGATITSQIVHKLGIELGGVEIASERFTGTLHNATLSAYDGTADYAGTSGASWQDVRTKGTAAWQSVSGLPTRLDIARRTVLTVGNASPAQSTSSVAATALVEWRWI